MPPSAEEFARWREDNVTRWVMRAHQVAAASNKAKWIELSWNSGAANQQRLTEWRTLADAYLALCDTTYEGFCEMLEEEPLRD